LRKAVEIACHPDPAGGYVHHGSRTPENIVLSPKRIGTLLEEVGSMVILGVEGLEHCIVKVGSTAILGVEGLEHCIVKVGSTAISGVEGLEHCIVKVGSTVTLGVEGREHCVVKEIHQKTRSVTTVFHIHLHAVHLDCVRKYKMCHGGSRLVSYKIYSFCVETC
jgi:hypothetical protein